MITRNATGAYSMCPFLSSTSHQCSISMFSPSKTNVSHCRRSIPFPRGLSGLFVYAWVAYHLPLSYPISSSSSSIPVFISSVIMFPDASSISSFSHVVVTLLPVSAPLRSNLSPATVSFVYSTICLRPSN